MKTQLPQLLHQRPNNGIICHYDIDQRSEEWHQLRIGKITGSTFYKLFGTKQAKEKYLFDKASEIVTGLKSDSEKNAFTFHMERGVRYEEEARDEYSLKNFSTIKECGLVQCGEYIACSPDGLVDNDGMIEIKIPDSGKYLMQILELSKYGIEKIPFEHQLQMQFNMYVCNRQWCDYVLYNPNHKATKKDLFIIRVERDKKTQTKISEVVDSSILFIQNIIKEYYNLSIDE